MIFPGQITTYVADIQVPWEYVWVEFDGLRTTEILNVWWLFQGCASLYGPLQGGTKKDGG